MFKWLARWKYRILFFFSIVGPGFITANVDNDANGITTYSQAGAQFGYTLLWTMIPITIALIVIQEMSARMGAATGKGLSDLIREEFGIRATFFVMLALVVVNFGNIIGEFSGIALSLQILRVPKWISVPVCAALVWLLIVKGNYKSVEKIFLVASFFYVAYIFAGVIAQPDWQRAAIETVIPPKFGELKTSAYLFMVVSIVGTTIAPWMQFYLQSSIVEKGVTKEQYGLSRLDVIVGCIFTDVVAWFIIVACAATLYAIGYKNINSATDAAYALRPLAGRYASLLFAAGFFNASLFAACILPLSTAYSVCEGLGFESGVERKFSEARVFYWLYTGLLIAGTLAVLRIPDERLIRYQILSQFINGALLPVILIFMLLLINKKELMGEHVNSRLFNVIAWLTTIVVIVLAIAVPFTQRAP
jgi:NRAMP (natural resistance-associated macrophage protein)-like metal ion transporter